MSYKTLMTEETRKFFGISDDHELYEVKYKQTGLRGGDKRWWYEEFDKHGNHVANYQE